MKLNRKIFCFLMILAINALLCGAAYHYATMDRETLFLPENASSQERIKVKKQFSGEKQVALTFDDGPHPVNTPRLLDGLKERGVKVSFFLLGESIDGNEELIKRMHEEGHLIGNHGYSHVQLSRETSEKACLQIDETNQKLCRITGQMPVYIRPPFGSWSEDLDCAVPMTVVLWSVDPLDWKSQNKAKVVKHIVKHVEPGGIILLHDVFPTSVDAALEVIDTLTEQGYTFVTVDELLVD